MLFTTEITHAKLSRKSASLLRWCWSHLIMNCGLILLFTYYIRTITASDPPRREDYPFEVFWNVPVEKCASLGEGRLLNKPWTMGFRQNENGLFFGDEINLLYNPGEFPQIDMPDTIVNGGLPQAGNLSVHLDKFKRDVLRTIKNPNFDGPAIISFHHWRPSWSLNGWMPRKIYKTVSRDYELQTNPNVTNRTQAGQNAKKKFEAAAKMFFVETLKKGLEVRPRALWGFDAYPVCFNIKGDLNNLQCKTVATSANDQLKEIYATGKAVYSAAYLNQRIGKGDFAKKHNRSEILYYRIKEAIRFNEVTNHTYMYIRLFYEDTKTLMSRSDIIDCFRMPCEMGMRGIIIWERSEQLSTAEKCENVYRYLQEDVGAAISAVEPCRKKRLGE